MGKSAIFIGIALILLGIFGVFKILSSNTSIFILIYPLLSIGIGIALIIFYKEEDKIEERKDLKKKKLK